MVNSSPTIAKELSETVEAFAIPIRVHGGALAVGQPVTFGVPLPKGRVVAPATAMLASAFDAYMLIQTEPLALWSDGSVQWLLVDALLPRTMRDGTYELKVRKPRADNKDRKVDWAQESTNVLSETPDADVIDTGVARFEVSRREFRIDVNSATVRLHLTDKKGEQHVPVLEQVRMETRGLIRTTLACEGRIPRLGLQVHACLSFFAGTGLVKAELTIHNPQRARHRGGLWDLGDPGSVRFRDLSLQVVLHKEETFSAATYSLNGKSIDSFTSPLPLDLYQDSSGGENWNIGNHVNDKGTIPLQFRGYRLRCGQNEQTGLRASPTVSVRFTSETVTVAIPHFWEQFPKALTANAHQLRVGLFPQEFNDDFELQGGERKTHTVWLRFDSTSIPDNPRDLLGWVHEPALVCPAETWCDDSETLAPLQISEGAPQERFQSFLDEALEGERSIPANRERADEYGWRNYGDVFADHEQAYYQGSGPLISHYNNQFDMVQGFLLHWLRTADRRWFEFGDRLARHVMDIDIYHTTEDRAAYNGGLFWFTDHYLHAHTSTHRTYASANRPEGRDYGGGPSAEHNFTTGLLHYHLLTGNLDARNAVIGLAEWVIAMDDGRRSVLGRSVLGGVDDWPTGLASATGASDYHGPGRAAGNSINALLDAWALTRGPHYFAYAELLIRRCIHPNDHLEARNLLDVEKRWSYTVFLTSLDKYLQTKAVEGEFDWMYAYAQQSLLNYARWMLENERPYFDQAEKLEYPTEAWAAQEFRKANVLRLAAQYAKEPLRSRLVARGEELAERAWSDLLRFSTRTCARALAIVMVEGWKDCVFRAGPLRSAPSVDSNADFGTPDEFVPQRKRLLARLKSPILLTQTVGRLLNPLRWTAFQRARRNPNSSGLTT